MNLAIVPNFALKTIEALQELKLHSLQNSDNRKFELDCASDINIKKISYRDSANIESNNDIPFVIDDEKLIMELPEKIENDSDFYLRIEYSAKPKRGFHFIYPDEFHPEKEIQAWTQGEMIESKYWFPCIDDPQIKFSREISVTIPDGFVAISNGILTEVSSTNNNQKTYTWKEEDPNPAYLTSIVIGKFYEY